MAGLITEEEFVAYMERIPAMEEKLNKLLLAFEQIAATGTLQGIQFNEQAPFVEYSEDLSNQQEAQIQLAKEKLKEAEKLKEEANAIQRDLGI